MVLPLSTSPSVRQPSPALRETQQQPVIQRRKPGVGWRREIPARTQEYLNLLIVFQSLFAPPPVPRTLTFSVCFCRSSPLVQTTAPLPPKSHPAPHYLVSRNNNTWTFIACSCSSLPLHRAEQHLPLQTTIPCPSPDNNTWTFIASSCFSVSFHQAQRYLPLH